MRGVCFFLLMALLLGWSGAGFAQQPTVEERLIRMEEGQKALVQRIDDTNRRIDDLRMDTNQRFEELRADMNQRFGAVDQRFGDMMFWLQLVFGAVFATLGAVVAQWLTIRRVTRLHVETLTR